MDQVVDEYVQAHDMQLEDLKYLMNEFSDELAQMRGKVADLGCGPGLGSSRLLEKLPAGATVTGIDISPLMLDYARKKHASENRLSFLELDLATKSLPPNLLYTFHYAVSVHCIHWCSEPMRVFENILKLLRPGGEAIVLFIARHPLYAVYPRLHDYPDYKPYMQDYLNFIPYLQNDENPCATAKGMLEATGFQVLHCSHRARTYLFENWDAVTESAIAVNPFIKRMPEELRRRYAEDLARELRNTEYAIVNETDEERKKQPRIMSIYRLLIAHIKKPNDHGCELQ